jgi:hypothetical protein
MEANMSIEHISLIVFSVAAALRLAILAKAALRSSQLA